MRAHAIFALACTAVLLAGCAATASPSFSPFGSASPVVPSTAPSTALASGTPGSATLPSPSATSGVFTSDRYGYTVPLPTGWTVAGATETWNGATPGSPGHDDPLVDQFTAPPRCASLWAYAAPTKLALTASTTQTTDAAAAEHPCSAGSQKPEKDEAVQVGGESARLLTVHCGILVLITVTIHKGTGFVFAFQDANGGPSFDAEDRATFVDFLKGIRFAN